jgi:hypothetical protein
MDPRKRWMTSASPDGAGWSISAPKPVGPLDTWLDRLRSTAGAGAIALGVDLPLGLPRAYAERHVSAPDFPSFLRGLTSASAFFEVAATLDQVSPARPFYPSHGVAGVTRLSQALALGMDGPAGLSRLCDRATPARPAGAPLFWTLGANQTGKAAITAWRDWLLPALAGPSPPRLWPFEGGLHDLLAQGGVVVAETYPAEAMRQRGLRMGGSKRRHTDRLALNPALRVAMRNLQATPSPRMQESLDAGFGADPAGEDRFDSLLGLLGLLAVIQTVQPDSIPDDPAIRRWEGWVLGQTAVPATPNG